MFEYLQLNKTKLSLFLNLIRGPPSYINVVGLVWLGLSLGGWAATVGRVPVASALSRVR